MNSLYSVRLGLCEDEKREGKMRGRFREGRRERIRKEEGKEASWGEERREKWEEGKQTAKEHVVSSTASRAS